MTKQQLHELCKILELPLTGDKQSLLVRVAGVLASQQGSWESQKITKTQQFSIEIKGSHSSK